VEAHPDALGEDVAARFALAAAVTPAQEAAARDDLARLRSRLDDVLGDRVLLLPSASSTAPTVNADADLVERTRQATLRLTAVAGLTGRPALSVPLLNVHQAGSLLDAPVGLSLVGPRFSDLALIALGEQLFAL
jgi:Asp-tRNA(Asn)/Glu-tRNA(Gln) amidotransferase A subunit family amidase